MNGYRDRPSTQNIVLAAIHRIGISQRQSNILAINEEHDYEKPLRK